MARKLIFNIEVPGVAQVNVNVPRPIPMWAVLRTFTVYNENALITIASLGITDIPAPLLRTVVWNRVFPPGSNLDWAVRLTAGTETIEGVIVGIVHP